MIESTKDVAETSITDKAISPLESLVAEQAHITRLEEATMRVLAWSDNAVSGTVLTVGNMVYFLSFYANHPIYVIALVSLLLAFPSGFAAHHFFHAEKKPISITAQQAADCALNQHKVAMASIAQLFSWNSPKRSLEHVLGLFALSWCMRTLGTFVTFNLVMLSPLVWMKGSMNEHLYKFMTRLKRRMIYIKG